MSQAPSHPSSDDMTHSYNAQADDSVCQGVCPTSRNPHSQGCLSVVVPHWVVELIAAQQCTQGHIRGILDGGKGLVAPASLEPQALQRQQRQAHTPHRNAACLSSHLAVGC